MNWHVPKNLVNNFIAGYTFKNICHQNLCPRYEQYFDPNKLTSDTILFLNLDYFEFFAEHLEKINFQGKFKLLTHNSDRDFSETLFNRIKDYVIGVYALNSTVSDPIIKKIPLGFNDQSTEILDTFDFKETEKNKLIYLNFKLHHHSDRPKCFELFEKMEWVDVERNLIPQLDYYQKLRDFKYCISPRGTGIDTHRVYESLLFGVIPIVKKNELSDLYENLPVVLVDEWNDVTKEFLEDNYQENIDRYMNWKEKNNNWYSPEFWIN